MSSSRDSKPAALLSLKFRRAVSILCLFGAPTFAQEPRTAEIRFDRDVKPILAHHCFKCHARGRSKGGLQMDDRERFLKGCDSGAVVRVGDAAQSRLIDLVSGKDPELTMPPADEGAEPLTPDQIAVLRRWIEQGLNWTDERIARPYALALRPVATPPGKGNPIDRLSRRISSASGFARCHAWTIEGASEGVGAHLKGSGCGN